MAFTGYQTFLSVVMVSTGTINLLGNQWTNTLYSKGSDGTTRKFDHPFVQTIFMFGGEMLCFLAFRILVAYYHSRQIFNADIISGNRNYNPLILFPAAMFDMMGTSLMYVGLVLTTAPSLMMLRGSVIVFVALLSRVFVGRRIKVYHGTGIFFIVIGLAVVGYSDFANKSTTGHTSSDMFYGDMLVVIAQILTACQMVYEEKYVVSKNIPPLQAVGWEGTFGFLVQSLLLIPFYLIKVPDRFQHNPHHALEDFPDALIQMKNNPLIGIALVNTMFSIAGLNFAGVSMTKEISATARMVLDSVRTFFIWIICLMLGWQDFHPLQLLGFGIVLVGMIIYYQIISCGTPFARVETARPEDEEIISQPADQP